MIATKPKSKQPRVSIATLSQAAVSPAVAGLVPTPPTEQPMPEDNAEDLLAKWTETHNSIDRVLTAEARLRKRIQALDDAESPNDSDIDELARLSEEVKLIPQKLGLLRRRAQAIQHDMARAFQIRRTKVIRLAVEVANRLRERTALRLVKSFDLDPDTAIAVAEEMPQVQAAEGHVTSVNCVVGALDIATTLHQLLQLQADIVQHAKRL